MTRMEKYKDLRRFIELENALLMYEQPERWLYLKTHQDEIRERVGKRKCIKH